MHKELLMIEYKPQTFANLRKEFGCEHIADSLLIPANYRKIINLLGEEGGRSKAFVFSTIDQRYIIKTITKGEMKVFISKLLPLYIKRISEFHKSRLVRIFGAFKFPLLKRYAIIMENVVINKEKSIIFDLKGSKAGRLVKAVEDLKNPPSGVVLKDKNFEGFGFKMNLDQEISSEIVNILIDDCFILKEAGVMDYSILLSIFDEGDCSIKSNRFSIGNNDGKTINIGIIDLFQLYDFWKIGENLTKTMVNRPDEISSINPEDYYLRICEYIMKILSS